MIIFKKLLDYRLTRKNLPYERLLQISWLNHITSRRDFNQDGTLYHIKVLGHAQDFFRPPFYNLRRCCRWRGNSSFANNRATLMKVVPISVSPWSYEDSQAGHVWKYV